MAKFIRVQFVQALLFFDFYSESKTMNIPARRSFNCVFPKAVLPINLLLPFTRTNNIMLEKGFLSANLSLEKLFYFNRAVWKS